VRNASLASPTGRIQFSHTTGVWLGVPRADPLVGLAITAAILLVLKDAVVQVWQRLMDAVDPDLLERARLAALGADGVEAVSEVRARWIGHTIHAEAFIVADCDLTLSQAHAVAERARHAMLHAVPKLASVTVHVDPCGHDGRDPHADLAHHDQRVAAAAESSSDRHESSHGRTVSNRMTASAPVAAEPST
jgi:divalent metal cation (Fe/Co/Zn/Cd) transporter